jgi:ABC-type polysaccharide/polyol phosphate transport system ATPase subunit
MNETAIQFCSVSKNFVRHKQGALLRSHVLSWFGEPTTHFQALKNVSFSLNRGDSVAVIGPNGAGKSTLLSLAAGIAQPDGGEVLVNGRVAALLELGSGFHLDLTGAENILMNAALLGFSRAEARKVMPRIIDFCELGEFLKEPLRTYSSGMIMRLAFAVAVHIEPDIFITDEVLAVGDQAFQTKCYEKIRDMRLAGKTMLCASHSGTMLSNLCNKAIWLDHGSLMMSGTLNDVLDAYHGSVAAVASQ